MLKKYLVPLFAVVLASTAGCSTLRGDQSSKDLASTGPSVLDIHTNPGTFELNRTLHPLTGTEIVASVKDFSSNVTSVTLKFMNLPIEVPMTSAGGGLWRCALSEGQLKQLAVAGKTMRYEVQVIAKDAKGVISAGTKTTDVAIKTPDLSSDVG